MSKKITIQKNTVQETLILPLYGRAYCAKKYPDVFSDDLSLQVINEIDYDFASLDLKEFEMMTWALRQRMLCDRVKAYLKKHPYATIIDLGCGLATEFASVDNGLCHWINIDLPDVIAVRQQLLPCQNRETNLIHDAFDLTWLDKINVDVSQGVYIICGGMLYYFQVEKIKELFIALAKHFPQGGIYFDCESSYGVKKANKLVEKNGNKGAHMYFAVDDAQKMFTSWSPLLKNIDVVSSFPEDFQKAKDIPWKVRMILKLGCRMGIMKFVEIIFA